uniref:Alcohol dehydrogenase-like N-terminal domain-containing protein n=1 Tax=Guillardia theta TaxID=55529 RepID=A0A7S4NQP0_GUITH|mmetsp:Transcript_29265/g.94015  ORF Transcript_29265/g.94015 Transcript_29265/m.94015 type:complete len:148 (+) Transcript_29265:51-494(+)
MYRKIVCEKLSTNFRECTRIMTAPLPKALNSGSILVKNEWCGINASDINFTNGKYMPGVKPPFDCGFEAMGKVAKVGENVTKLKEGDSVVYTSFGAFSEYQEIDARAAVSLPKIMPEALPLFVSGLTASIALEQVSSTDAKLERFPT